MGILFCKTTGSATNSGSTDTDAASLSGSAATAVTTVISLDGSPDLSALVTSGASQSSIYLAQATNSNRKIFWITAFDNSAKTVSVDTAPTGITTSGWAIGGRIVHTPANFESALRAGDIYEFGDSPASRTTGFWTARNAGDSVSGFVTMRGKAGVRPKLTVTNTSVVLNGNSIGNLWVENLEVAQQGATGNVISGFSTGSTIYNVKVSDGGGHGILSTFFMKVINCEITGVNGDGINSSFASFGAIRGCYIHDNGGNGITLSGVGPFGALVGNIIDSNVGEGIYLSGASTTQGHLVSIDASVIYGNLANGLRVADADTVVGLTNSIFKDNGDAAGEFNVKYDAGSAELVGYHSNNVFHTSALGGSGNLSGLTVNSTEFTTDPLFTAAASGDFSISGSSPAAATGYPGAFLGGSTGFRDIGAVQRTGTSGGGSTGAPLSRVNLGM